MLKCKLMMFAVISLTYTHTYIHFIINKIHIIMTPGNIFLFFFVLVSGYFFVVDKIIIFLLLMWVKWIYLILIIIFISKTRTLTRFHYFNKLTLLSAQKRTVIFLFSSIFIKKSFFNFNLFVGAIVPFILLVTFETIFFSFFYAYFLIHNNNSNNKKNVMINDKI